MQKAHGFVQARMGSYSRYGLLLQHQIRLNQDCDCKRGGISTRLCELVSPNSRALVCVAEMYRHAPHANKYYEKRHDMLPNKYIC